MRIALLTMFNTLSPTYSVVSIVKEQVEMFLSAGHTISILVTERCVQDGASGIFLDSRIEWGFITNSLDGQPIRWYDYCNPEQQLHPTFNREVTLTANDFVRHLQNVDLCILHDILYQGLHYVHNIAIRMAQKQLPSLRFIAFTHSKPTLPPRTIGPLQQARFCPMPYTLFAYPTHSGLSLLATQYHVPESRCRLVNHSLSLLAYLSPEVQSLHEAINLLDSEILIIYPARLTRSKGFEKIAKLAGALSPFVSDSIKIVFCDTFSPDSDATTYKQQIRADGQSFGMLPEHIYFISDYSFPKGLSRQAVLDLFSLSNLFICPSFSESFGLTVLEAASRGNLLVLNETVDSLYELGQTLGSYFMAWEGLNRHITKPAYIPNERAYYTHHAELIFFELTHNPVLRAKTQTRLRYNPSWIYKNQLEPLLESALNLSE